MLHLQTPDDQLWRPITGVRDIVRRFNAARKTETIAILPHSRGSSPSD